MDSTASITPSTPWKTQHLDHDTRCEILFLHSIKWHPHQIYDHYKCHTLTNTVDTSCNKGTPKKRRRRPTKLLAEQGDKLEAFIAALKKTRRMSYQALVDHFKFNQDLTNSLYTDTEAIKRCLQRRGYSHRIALRKGSNFQGKSSGLTPVGS
jgi:hypothetical protein